MGKFEELLLSKFKLSQCEFHSDADREEQERRLDHAALWTIVKIFAQQETASHQATAQVQK